MTTAEGDLATALNRCLAPAEQAFSLPPAAYRDTDVQTLEAERVFARGDRLGGRETVEVHPGSGERPPPQPNRKVRFTVLHEDPHVVGVLKPSGVAMHPGPGHGNDTLLNGLIEGRGAGKPAERAALDGRS